MSFPTVRLRRNRQTQWSRRLVAENRIATADLILPIIIIDGENRRETIATMPGVERLRSIWQLKLQHRPRISGFRRLRYSRRLRQN